MNDSSSRQTPAAPRRSTAGSVGERPLDQKYSIELAVLFRPRSRLEAQVLRHDLGVAGVEPVGELAGGGDGEAPQRLVHRAVAPVDELVSVAGEPVGQGLDAHLAPGDVLGADDGDDASAAGAAVDGGVEDLLHDILGEIALYEPDGVIEEVLAVVPDVDLEVFLGASVHGASVDRRSDKNGQSCNRWRSAGDPDRVRPVSELFGIGAGGPHGEYDVGRCFHRGYGHFRDLRAAR